MADSESYFYQLSLVLPLNLMLDRAFLKKIIVSIMIKRRINRISSDELLARMDHNKNLLLVDTRPSELYANGHIPGAVSIPAQEVRASAGKYGGDLEVITYTSNVICKESIMSDICFIEMGFENVSDYAGGMADWVEKKHPVEKFNK